MRAKDALGVELWTTAPSLSNAAAGVVGYIPYAFPFGFDPVNSLSTTIASLAAVSGGNGGALQVPIFVPGPMFLETITIWNRSSANLRTAEARLYLDSANDSNTLTQVSGSDTTWSFTPGAEGLQTSAAVSAAPVSLDAGTYWLVIRNTSTAQTFQIGGIATVLGKNLYATKSIAALGATLDMVAATWAKATGALGLCLNGRSFGQTTAY